MKDMMSTYWEYRNKVINEHGNKAIVWMEVGSFMEQYAPCQSSNDDDIWKVGRLINYNVQRKNKNDQTSAWFLGFPKASLGKCLEILTSNGYTICLSEQQPCENTSAKILQRPITRIVTPGTYYERDTFTQNHNICCIHTITTDVHQLCVIDTTIGDLHVLTTRNEDELRWFLSVYDPVEVVWLKKNGTHSTLLRNRRVIEKAIDRHASYFDANHQNAVLSKVYHTDVISNRIAFEVKPVIVCLFDYLTVCHEKILQSISIPKLQFANKLSFHNNAMLQLDMVPQKSGQGLLSIIDFTSTPMGKRLLKTQLLNPCVIHEDIIRFHDDVNTVNKDLTSTLKRLPDLDRLTRRLDLQIFTLSHLKQLYDACKLIVQLDRFITTTTASSLIHFIDHRIDFENEGVREGFDAQCDEYLNGFKQSLYLLELEVSRIPLVFNEKSLCKIEQSDKEYFVYSTSKKVGALKNDSTLSNKYLCKTTGSSTRISNPVLNDLCTAAHNGHITYHQYANQLIRSIIDEVCQLYSADLKTTSAQIAYVDTLVSRRILESVPGYIRPMIIDERTPGSFVNGRAVKHPIVNHLVAYIGNNVAIDNDINGVVVYGLNGAGKSTYGKSVALNIILAQSGFPVCADEFTVKPFTQMFARINCDDDVYEGHSSFQVEIHELSNILMFADDRSFIIADELCKGTEHASAIALVSSTVVELLSRNVKFIFASHLHEIKHYVQQHSEYALKLSIKHMTSHFDDTLRTIVYDRTLADGQGDELYGVEVAKHMMAKFCPNVIYTAFKIRKQLMHQNTTIVGTPSRYNSKKHKTNCERCGIIEPLDIHHIQPQQDFDRLEKRKMNNVSNLMTLCKKCHTEYHRGSWKIATMDTPNGKTHLVVEE